MRPYSLSRQGKCTLPDNFEVLFRTLKGRPVVAGVSLCSSRCCGDGELAEDETMKEDEEDDEPPSVYNMVMMAGGVV
jgi:hypothetical protein